MFDFIWVLDGFLSGEKGKRPGTESIKSLIKELLTMPTTFINNNTFISAFIFSCNHQAVLDVDKVNNLCLRIFFHYQIPKLLLSVTSYAT